jgi:polyphosphate kinase
MKDKDLDSPALFLNRELSWLEFNDRVLREGLDEDVPLLERLKFLAIVSSNLDEFFMIRVAGIKQQLASGRAAKDPSGLMPAEQLARISQRVHRMVAEQAKGIPDVLRRLRRHGFRVLDVGELSPEQLRFAEAYFASDVLPVLTPLAIGELEPFPTLPGLGLHLAVALERPGEGEARLAVVPVPPGLPRFITIPPGEGLVLARLEDVMAAQIAHLFPGCTVLATSVFRITRDADIEIADDDAADLLREVEDAVRSRRARSVVRLEVSAEPDPPTRPSSRCSASRRLSRRSAAHKERGAFEGPAPTQSVAAREKMKKWLMDWCEVADEDVYEVEGMLDAAALMSLASRPGFDALKAPDWPPQTPRDLLGHDDLWQAIQDHDVLLFHPYESFEPVVRLVELAADDPGVLAIKQTLYRTSGGSPIIAALARAAENGKQVTVLVELRARFDEAKNVNWARSLEEAGCHVLYGIAGLKTHGKALLIIRREPHGVRRYVHLSTGNYNDRTARLYSDIGLMTCDRDIAADTSAFFNLLTGYSQAVGWLKFAISPTDSRQRFYDLIEREIRASTPDQPGLIMVKVNSLEDKRICQALYRASQAGVKVLLNVRGLCCLRPGIEGVSDHITVVSIVDRFLEHARVFYFRNGGHEEVYLSSADWMGRNLDRRLEILFPVGSPPLRTRLIGILETCFADDVKARRLGPDGTYPRAKTRGKGVRAQEKFYKDAIAATRAAAQAPVQFRPLTKPS